MHAFRRTKVLLTSAFFVASGFFSSMIHADTIETGSDFEQFDLEALRDWINNKRQVTVKELGGDLSISGEVRTEFQTASEIKNGSQLRGYLPGQLPRNSYDVEVNLMLDYRNDNTWAAIKIEFDNDAGVFGGTLNKIKLEKAYFGVRVLSYDTMIFDFEIGRRRFSTVFDSKVQFNSFFDGILLRYDQSFPTLADLYLHAGTFVIDERRNQYGYIGELGMLNIANTGAYMKYSVVDWNTKEYSSADFEYFFKFIVSQFMLGYKFRSNTFNKMVHVYGAMLYNHSAPRAPVTFFERYPWGGYAGFAIGQLKKKGDWAFDANYQIIEGQCFPSFDSAAVGLGSTRTGFYTKTAEGGGGLNAPGQAEGNTNFRGFSITLDYLVTNSLNFQQNWVQAITLSDTIGPFSRYKQYEIEFIYSF